MAEFTRYDIETAPEASRVLMEESEKSFGFVPNLHKVMAESPEFLDGYKQLHDLFSNCSLDNDDKTVVWQTINVEHACTYCVPGHTGIAYAMGVDESIVNALRDETPLPTAKLEALRSFTLQVLRTRGNVTDAEVDAFLAAGYTKRNVMDVLLGMAQKVMSNYVNHIAGTETDAQFAKFDWSANKAA